MCFCFEKMSILHLHPPVFKSGNKIAFSLYGITSFFLMPLFIDAHNLSVERKSNNLSLAGSIKTEAECSVFSVISKDNSHTMRQSQLPSIFNVSFNKSSN